MTTLYTAEASATGGREGHARSSDGVLDVDLRRPKEMGGPGGATNPEQLFAAGYAACFQSALELVARQSSQDVTGSKVTAEVGLAKNDAGGFGLEVELRVQVPNLEKAEAEALVQKAHEVCPYSNATRNNIDVALTVE